jgi:hypothetical protein
MLRKLISRTALAVALAGFLAMGTSAAEAKTHVYLWLGMPGFPYWDGPGYYGNAYRDRLSCAHGRWIVDHRGYNSVRATDYSPRYYHYRARKNSKWYSVRLDSWTGRIMDVWRSY